MRKLDRGLQPGCLSNYRHGRDEWGDVSKIDKSEIWDRLFEMQGNVCAYCESRFSEQKHIEHFFRRREKPRMTFDWNNLFGSCNKPDSCGEYKDNKASSEIDLSKVCKPDVMNPEDYFVFTKDGSVVLKSGLSKIEIEVAENTINIFNLNGSSRLVSKRREAARSEAVIAQDYYELLAENVKEGGDEMREYLEDFRKENLERIKKEEHFAVLKQIWNF